MTVVWRRATARSLDALWQAGPAAAVVWYFQRQVHELEWFWLLGAFAFGASALQLIAEPLWLATLGATPGKALLGLQVVNARRPGPLTYRSALARTIKVLAWGFGLWILPLSPFALLVSWVALRRHPAQMIWDRSAQGSQVEPRERTSTLVARSLLGLVAPAALVLGATAWLATINTRVGGLTFADVQLFLTGRWVFLHALTGKEITLDGRWRKRHDELSLKRGIYSVVFAREGSEAFVELRVKWQPAENARLEDDEWGPPSGILRPRPRDPIRTVPPAPASPPHMARCMATLRYSLEVEGFSFIDVRDPVRTDSPTTCRASGGRASGATVSHVELERVKFDYNDHEVAYSWDDGDDPARRDAEALASELAADAKNIKIVSGFVSEYFWRNALTGVIARIPGWWEFKEFSYEVKNAGTMQTFARLDALEVKPARHGIPTIGEVVAPPLSGEIVMRALPGETPDAIASEWTGVMREIVPGATFNRRTHPNGDIVIDLPSGKETIRFWIRGGRRYTWFSSWGGARVQEPDQHELLKALLPTLR
jgi:RDD family